MIGPQQMHAGSLALRRARARIVLRPAESGDVPWLLEQLRAFDRYFAAHRSLFPDDVEWVRAQLLRWMDPAGGCFIIAEHPGAIVPERVGFIVGVLTPHHFNPAIRTLVEVLWWVKAAWRNSAAGPRLLDAYVAYGQVHADWIVCTHRDTSAGKAALERRGLLPYERAYLMEVTR